MAYNNPQEFIFLSTQTASSSASLSFTSLITSTYPVYYIKIRNLLPATNATTLLLTFSTNNGSTYLSGNYGWCNFVAYSAGNVNLTSANLAATSIQIGDSFSTTSTRLYNANIYLYNANSTNVCTVKGEAVHYDSNANLSFITNAGINTGTTAINAIKFAMSAGNIASGTISLYGMTI